MKEHLHFIDTPKIIKNMQFGAVADMAKKKDVILIRSSSKPKLLQSSKYSSWNITNNI